jgi:hypothetical protein
VQDIPSLIAKASVAERKGSLDEAEGFLNDAVGLCASSQDYQVCYPALASFLDRRGRVQEADNIRLMSRYVLTNG